MDKAVGNPIFIALLFILRCVIPLAIMLGISYLFRRFGLVAEPSPPPPDYENNGNNLSDDGKGDPSHA